MVRAKPTATASIRLSAFAARAVVTAFLVWQGIPAFPAWSEQASDSAAGRFRFAAFGDMPYDLPEDYARLENLIEAVNAAKPAFTIHVGDFKTGSAPCGDKVYSKMRGYLDSFAGPLILTPGDNDWADCDRWRAGSYDPNERLSQLRRVFYPEAHSMGAAAISLTRQADVSDYADMVENAIWQHENVLFATVHMVGHDNNRGDDEEEFEARNAANLAWIGRAFTRAAEEDLAGVVLAFHADVFGFFARRDSFAEALSAIAAAASRLGKPVLLIHGDGHRYIVDQPLAENAYSGPRVANVTRIEVFGSSDMHAVEIAVNPDNPALFEIAPLIVEKNISD